MEPSQDFFDPTQKAVSVVASSQNNEKPTSNKKFAIIITLIAVSTLLLLSGVYFWSIKASKLLSSNNLPIVPTITTGNLTIIATTTIPNPTINISTQSVELKAYENSKLGFSLLYPST